MALFLTTFDTLGDEVWRSDGIKVLGTSLGSSEFVALQMEETTSLGSNPTRARFAMRIKSCSKAQAPVFQPITHKSMMKACGTRRRRFLAKSPDQQRR